MIITESVDAETIDLWDAASRSFKQVTESLGDVLYVDIESIGLPDGAEMYEGAPFRLTLPRRLAASPTYINALIDEIREALLDLHLVACQEPN